MHIQLLIQENYCCGEDENNMESKINEERTIAIIGLGYVGLPLAIAFSENYFVIGYDIDSLKIEQLKKGLDITGQVDNNTLLKSKIFFTTDETKLIAADFFIITVPTPVKEDFIPDTSHLVEASKTVGRYISYGDIVVYESTVAPGFTREYCMKILENESSYNCGRDFKLGYSPERMNPSDKINTLKNITKIVSGIDKESLEEITYVYSSIVGHNIHKVSSLEVAEATKLIENCQRDVNIAFMNEISLYLAQKSINTNEVISAMNTKWNALKFSPGLVGGHCVGVDPYYLIDDAKKLNCSCILSENSRIINNYMGKYIADKAIEYLNKNGKSSEGAKIGILGCTFKENCPDIRNSRVFDVIRYLKEENAECIVMDSVACKSNYNSIEIHNNMHEMKDLDCIIVAVAHNVFQKIQCNDLINMFHDNIKIILDVKGLFSSNKDIQSEFIYWKL